MQNPGKYQTNIIKCMEAKQVTIKTWLQTNWPAWQHETKWINLRSKLVQPPSEFGEHSICLWRCRQILLTWFRNLRSFKGSQIFKWRSMTCINMFQFVLFYFQDMLQSNWDFQVILQSMTPPHPLLCLQTPINLHHKWYNSIGVSIHVFPKHGQVPDICKLIHKTISRVRDTKLNQFASLTPRTTPMCIGQNLQVKFQLIYDINIIVVYLE